MKTKSIGIALAFAAIVLLTGEKAGAENAFNRLVLQKAELERQFGVKGVECFPFLENYAKGQPALVRDCLAGVETLRQALAEVPDADIQTVGISSRFLKTAGFHTVLVPWNASKDEVADFLRRKTPPEEQKRFLEEIRSLKKPLQEQLGERPLYCSQRISNDQCLLGYQTLAAAMSQVPRKETKWPEIVIDGPGIVAENPNLLELAFNSSAEEMRRTLFQTDPMEKWSKRKKTYDLVQERHGDVFRAGLQLPNFFCSMDLAAEECLQGAANLSEAGKDKTLRDKLWGRATVHRFNTGILNDFDVTVRFDLPPAEIVRFFSAKPSKDESQKTVTLAEDLETRAKGNRAGLRAVCDLIDLRSALCVQGLSAFIEFLKTHRDYRAASPWSELMFVDGDQLGRVNFALNSPFRDRYIYADANGGPEELAEHLRNFSSQTNASSDKK
ncbi:MAG: hypothetical protein HY579_11490 [Nitrospinae bacterium]|nr:hypothetical protein [Nitrospinota bacterium]